MKRQRVKGEVDHHRPGCRTFKRIPSALGRWKVHARAQLRPSHFSRAQHGARVCAHSRRRSVEAAQRRRGRLPLRRPACEQDLPLRSVFAQNPGTLAASDDGRYIVLGEEEALSQLMVFPVR